MNIEAGLITALNTALSGPGAAFMLLCVVLYFGWRLLSKLLHVFSDHLKAIEQKFDKLVEVLDKKVGRLEDRLDDVHEDVQVIRRRLRDLDNVPPN